MDWEQLLAHLHAHHTIVHEELEWLGVIVGNGQSVQKVRIDRLQEVAVLFRADVCAEESLDPRLALRHNATLGAGALALDQGIYLMRHVAMLNALSSEEINRVISVLAREAVQVRAQSAAPDHDTPLHAFSE